jgi:predicted nucleic acid-binding protein
MVDERLGAEPSRNCAIAESARNYRTLRALGITVRGTVDCLIATFCMQNHHQLLHSDAEFDHFERNLGLSVLHP